MDGLYRQVKDLHGDQRYLEAYELTKSLWGDPRSLSGIDRADALILAISLSRLLGAEKLSEALIRRAVKRFPDDPWVRFNYAHRIHGFQHHFDRLKFYDAHPAVESGDRRLDGLEHAQRAMDWAYVREFGLAHDHLEKAFELESDAARLHYGRAQVLLYEDRPSDALADAEQVFALKPYVPYAVDIFQRVLSRLNRYEEAAERTWDAVQTGRVQTYQYIQAVMRSQGALADRRGTDELAERMLFLCGELERTAPLADRRTQRSIRLSKIDAFLLNDRLDDAAALAEETEHAFYGKVFKHYRNRRPEAVQRILRHEPVLQDRMHCLPASVSVVLSHFGESVSQQEIAGEITMEGTSVAEMARWLRRRGYQAIHFMITEESARAVLGHGVPFVYHETYESSAHSMAMVGMDDRLGLFLIHDPGYHRLSQLLASSISDGEAPIGAHGMVVLPPGAEAPELRPEWVEPAEAYFEYFEACRQGGPDAGKRYVDQMTARFPEHPMTHYLRAELYHRTGCYSEAQELLMELFRNCPRCVYFRRLLLTVLRSLDNTGLMREVLYEMVRKGSVRGVKPDKKFRLPMATYKCQYADYVRMSADGLSEAYRYINMALKQEPGSGEAYHVLGDILMEEERTDEAVLAYRTASCLAPDHSHYAQACFEQLKRCRGRDEALGFMKERAERLGRHPQGMEAWDDYVRALEDAEEPHRAVDEMKALLEFHAENLTAHSYAARLFARLGEWDAAWESVNRLNSGENEALYLPAAADLLWHQRDLNPGLELSERWVLLEPWNRDARWSVIRFAEALHDRETAFAYAERWFRECPGNEMIENIYLNRLRYMNRRPQKIEVLRGRVERNPKDAWAWRELGFDYAAEMTGSEGEAFEAAGRGLRECIEKSRELSPGWAVTALEAALAEAEGRGRDALESWLETLASWPDYEYAMGRAWDLATGLGGDVKADVLEHTRRHLFARKEVGDTKLIYSVCDRYGYTAAAELLLAMKERFPHAPALESCHAWLVLNYSGGAPDLGSRAEMLAGLRAAHQRYPAHRGIVLALAETLRREELLDEAEKLLADWVELNRNDVDSVGRLVEVLRELGRDTEVETLLRRTLEACPEEPEVYHLLASFLGRAERLNEALDVYRRGLERLPEAIGLRDQCCDFCLNHGFDAVAVEVARAGTDVYPDGAYLWYRYGVVLYRAEWTDDATDPVEALRRALGFNSRLYDAADQLAAVLNLRSRYDEAIEVMEPFADDPENSIYARGRMLHIRRCRAKAHGDDEAAQAVIGEAVALTEEAPDYEWIWRRLIDWIAEDRCWELAREVLVELPAVMQDAPYFRSSRLSLLRKAGSEGLEDEWHRLLSEYPRDAYLHNDCFDEFWAIKKQEEGIAVLEALRERRLGNIWTDIRLVQGYAKLSRTDETVSAARRVWLSTEDLSMEDDNASIFSWNRILEAAAEVKRAVLDDFPELLAAGQAVRPGAIRKFCDFLDTADERTVRRLLGHAGRLAHRAAWLRHLQWLASFVVLDVPQARVLVRKALLDLLLAAEWAQGVHYAAVIIAGEAGKGSMRIADRLLKKRPGIDRENMDVWGACSYVYYSFRPKWLLDNMPGWRERPGAKTWQILNFLSLHHREKPEEAELRLNDSLAVLERFGHGGNTVAFAWLAVDSAMRLEHFADAVGIYQRFEMYLGREVQEDEFIPNSFKYMPDVYPLFMQLFETGTARELDLGFNDAWERMGSKRWLKRLWRKARKAAPIR